MRKTLYLAAAIALLLPSLALAQGTEPTSYGSLELTGTLTVAGAQTYTGAATFSSTATFNGVVALGDGGDTVAVNSSAWDISTAGAVSGVTTLAMTGALSGATTIGCSGNVLTTGGYYVSGAAPPASLAADNQVAYGGTGIRVEGTNDGNEALIDFEDPAADTYFLFGADGDLRIAGAYDDVMLANTVSISGVGIAWEGTVNGFEGHMTFADPAADFTFAFGVNGTLDVPNTLTANAGDIQADNGSIISADLDGFSGNAGELVSGVPTVRMDIVGGTNSTEYLALETCEAGAAATWTAGGAEAPALADDPAVFRAGAGAVSITFTAGTAVGNATVTTPNGANWDGTGDEYIFFWVMSSVPLTAGTLTLTLDDNNAAPDPVLDFPAIPVANAWQLCRLDMSAVGAGDKDIVSDSIIISNHATELQGAVVWIDQMVKVDAADASALGFDVINQPHGVRSAVSFVEDAGNGTWTALVEWTDYFVDYVNDDIYWISNQSANNDILLYASAD